MAIPFAEKTITVFNSYTVLDEYNKTKTKWTSYVFSGNSLFKKQQKTKISDKVVLEGDYYIAQAPYDDNYCPFYEWVALEDKTNKFTVQNGDIVVMGNFDIMIPDNSNPISELKKLYPGIIDIAFTSKTAESNISDEFNDEYDDLRHFFWSGE